MPSLPPRRLMLFVAPGLLVAAAGGAAIADPDGSTRALTPTAQLAQSGGVAAPAPVSGGGVSAPAAGDSAPESVLPVEVEEDGAPLIDISPAYVPAEPLRSRVDLTAAAAQTGDDEEEADEEEDEHQADENEDEDKVIIPIPPEDLDDGDQAPTAREPSPRGRVTSLPSTGGALAGPGLTALLLLFAGAALRRRSNAAQARA